LNLISQFKGQLLEDDDYQKFREFFDGFEKSEPENLKKILMEKFDEEDFEYLKGIRRIKMVEVKKDKFVPRKMIKIRRKRKGTGF
jgi:hypothetical protein